MIKKFMIFVLMNSAWSVGAGEHEVKREASAQKDPRCAILDVHFPAVLRNLVISYLPTDWPFMQRNLKKAGYEVTSLQLFRSGEREKLMVLTDSRGDPGELFLYDIEAGEQELCFECKIKSAKVSPVGNVLAYVTQHDRRSPSNRSYPYKLCFYDLRRERGRLMTETIHNSSPSYAFSVDGVRFVSASADGSPLRIWDINSPMSLYNPAMFNLSAQVASVSPSGDKVLLEEEKDEGEFLSMWCIVKNKKGRMDIKQLWSCKTTIFHPNFSPCGTYIIGQARGDKKDSEIILLDPSSGNRVRNITLPSFPRHMSSCMMSVDARYVLFLPLGLNETRGEDPNFARLHIVDMAHNDGQGHPAVKYYGAKIPINEVTYNSAKLLDARGPYLAYVDRNNEDTVIIRAQFGDTEAVEEDDAPLVQTTPQTTSTPSGSTSSWTLLRMMRAKIRTSFSLWKPRFGF